MQLFASAATHTHTHPHSTHGKPQNPNLIDCFSACCVFTCTNTHTQTHARVHTHTHTHPIHLWMLTPTTWYLASTLRFTWNDTHTHTHRTHHRWDVPAVRHCHNRSRFPPPPPNQTLIMTGNQHNRIYYMVAQYRQCLACACVTVYRCVCMCACVCVSLLGMRWCAVIMLNTGNFPLRLLRRDKQHANQMTPMFVYTLYFTVS